MSLRDELPTHSEHAVFSRIRQSEHEEIDRQISEFIACGGAIISVGPSETSDPLALRTIRNEFTGKPDYQSRIPKKNPISSIKDCALVYDGKNRSKTPSKYGQNVLRRVNNGEEHFILLIAKKYYGQGKNWTHEQAIKERDRIRVNLGLQAAEY